MKNIEVLENEILPLILNKISKNCIRQNDIFLKPYGFSKHHALYITCLYKYSEGLRMNDFNDIIGCDKANTSRAIADLLGKGLIYKDTANESEKKFKVKLTEQGYKIANMLIEDNKKNVEKMMNMLTEEESNMFLQILRKISCMED